MAENVSLERNAGGGKDEVGLRQKGGRKAGFAPKSDLSSNLIADLGSSIGSRGERVSCESE